MEFHPPSIEEYGVKPRAIYDFMKSLGYDMKITLRNSLPFEELEKIAIENIGINLLCTRNESSFLIDISVKWSIKQTVPET
jgi:hypothetical protein